MNKTTNPNQNKNKKSIVPPAKFQPHPQLTANPSKSLPPPPAPTPDPNSVQSPPPQFNPNSLVNGQVPPGAPPQHQSILQGQQHPQMPKLPKTPPAPENKTVMPQTNVPESDFPKICARIQKYFDICRSMYTPIHKRMRLLDAVDAGDFWKAIRAKMPPYQILPDTNYVSYIKNNLLASIYCIAKGASIQPTSEEDKDAVVNLNVGIERIWDMLDVGYYQFLAGERAALMNIGITQVGWNEDATKGAGNHLIKGMCTLKNIDPIKFMRDPFAPSLETAHYCMTYERLHKSVIENNPRYKERFKQFLATHQSVGNMAIPENYGKQYTTANASIDPDYYVLVTCWIKEHGVVSEYHTLNCSYMLYARTNIKPNDFPFAILYCNAPAGKLTGISECSKIFANNVAHNLMDSLALTVEYKNQHPPKFVSTQAGLNVQTFAKHGDEADRTFLVNGIAKDAVHFQQFPPMSMNVNNLQMGLEKGIEMMTGVDQKYTGRNTGSVITTGGVEEMLNRVTVIDEPKIMHMERYTKKLTELLLRNYLEFAPDRDYMVKDPSEPWKWKSVKVPFKQIDPDTVFDYAIDISSEMPKNKQRVAEMANDLMEKQMQYSKAGLSVDLITEEEWLMLQDLPNKEYMLKRMGIDRDQDAITSVTQVLFQYTNLVKNGMSPDDAILATANTLKQSQSGGQDQPQGETDIPAAALNSQLQQTGMSTL